MKSRPEPGQRFGRGVAPRALVDIERHGPRGGRAVAGGGVGQVHRQRHDLVGETAGLDGGDGALVAAQREGVLRLARDLRLPRVVLGHQAGCQVDVRVAVHQRRVRRDLVPAHGHEAHRLGAAGDDGRRCPAHDPLGAVGDGLQARGAEAVHRDGRCGDRNAGAKARDAGDVHALLGLGHRAAEDDVVDLGRIELLARASAAWIVAAAMSSGRVVRSVPAGALPTAVRTAETITASFIRFSTDQPCRNCDDGIPCGPIRRLAGPTLSYFVGVL